MSLRFVKTAVLTSENGIEYSKEEVLETEETKMARIQAERASRKSLYEQLEEQKLKKQADYDAVTKQIFAPPKALDEEEFGFLDSLTQNRLMKEEQIKQKEAEALEAFRSAVKESRSIQEEKKAIPMNISIPKPQEKKAETSAPIMPVVIRAKRKIESSTENSTVQQKSQKTDSQASASSDQLKADTEKKTSGVAALGSLLGDYGSDDDEENDN